MKELYETIGQCFLELAKQCEDPPPAKKTRKTKTISFTELRGYLAELSRSGKTAEVRELILSYGKDKLSDIEPKDYESLLTRAKEIQDA